jgi:hypothetical protein
VEPILPDKRCGQVDLWPVYATLVFLLTRHFLEGVQNKLAVLLVRLAQQTAEFVQKLRVLA